MPPSSLADYRQRTVCQALIDHGRCRRGNCGFSHYLVDPSQLRRFAGNFDETEPPQDGSENLLCLTLDFTCTRGDASSGKWRVQVHGGVMICTYNDHRFQSSKDLQVTSTSLPGALWALEKKICNMCEQGELRVCRPRSELLHTFDYQSNPTLQPWNPGKQRLTVCKKFEIGKAHDGASCRDRHDLINFKRVEDILLHDPGTGQNCTRWCLRFTYSSSSDVGFAWEITDAVQNHSIVSESHDLAMAVNSLMEYLESRLFINGAISAPAVSVCSIVICETHR